jgi:dTMP kinase
MTDELTERNDSEQAELRSTEHSYPGRLVVVEGIDGSGKSTQLYLLKRFLELGGYKVHFTEWNSSPLVKDATSRGKQEQMLTPMTFSMIHAADFADRCERQILPLLKAGYLVLADRYIYTAFSRDGARGVPVPFVRKLYSFAPVPDITFYYRAPLEVSLRRILSGRPRLKYHEAGMDMGLSLDPVESFRLFQGMIQDQYDAMVGSDDFVQMDATKSVDVLQAETRDIVRDRIDLSRFELKS